MTGRAAGAADAFRALHRGDAPPVLPSVWDAVSARAFAGAGFPAPPASPSAARSTTASPPPSRNRPPDRTADGGVFEPT